MSYKATSYHTPTGTVNIGPIYVDSSQIQHKTLFYICRLPNNKVRLKCPIKVSFQYKSDNTDGKWIQTTVSVTDVVFHGGMVLSIPLTVDGREWSGVSIGGNFRLLPDGPTAELLYAEN